MQRAVVFALLAGCVLAAPAHAQLRDVTQAPNAANEGIRKSLTAQTGPGRGDASRFPPSWA